MRMRLKKHLDERMQGAKSILALQEPNEFFALAEEQRNMQVEPTKLFGNNNPLVLELGCGKGSFAIQWAQAHPNCNLIALEKLSNVIIVGCEEALKQGVGNLKFFNCRAENLPYFLPKHSVSQIILNFSCPFPKKTYANRRLTSKNFLNLYKQLLTDDGVIVQKTDDRNFFEYSLESFAQNGYTTFDVTYDLPADKDGNIVTEYESKFRAIGKPIHHLKAKLQ